MSELKGKVFPVMNNKFKLNTKGVNGAEEDMMMPKDLTSFSVGIDGTVEEWYAMDAEGWAKAMMTAKKLSISFQGKRCVGDPGNDYVADLAWKFGNDAMSKFSWEMVSGAKLEFECVINVTAPGGGESTALDALEFEVICYGKPTFTPAAAAVAKLSAKA